MILMYYMIRFEIFAVSLVVFEGTYWRRTWEPTSMFLPGESQGQGSLVGHTESMGLHRVGHDWSDLAAAAVYIRVEVVLVDCHALFQRIFPTQGSNPGLSHCRWILYHLSHRRRIIVITILNTCEFFNEWINLLLGCIGIIITSCMKFCGGAQAV